MENLFNKSLQEKFLKLKEVVKGDYEDEFDVSDLIIYTEEYQEEYYKQYIEENKEIFEKIDQLDKDELVKEVQESEKTNMLLEKLKENPEKKRLTALRAILKTKNLKIKSKNAYQNVYPKFFNNSSFNTKVFNLLKRSLFPQFQLNVEDFSKNSFYINVICYSSFNQKKIAEYFFHEETSLDDFLNTFNCVVSDMLQNQFKKFALIENQFITTDYKQPVSLDTQNVFNILSMRNINLKMIQAQSLKWSDLDFKLQQTYILRDAQSCDHFFVIKDVIFAELLNYKDQKIIQNFYPRIQRRNCDCCKNIKASLLVKNSQVTLYPFIFLCNDCYKDMHWDKEDIQKESQHVVYNYFSEEII